MGTVLFAWQCGGGLGHLVQMRPLARGLAAQSHRLFVAFRNLSSAVRLYGDVGVKFLQAPYRPRGLLPFPVSIGFAHVMANVGFGNDEDLFALASAWRNLFCLVKPDLIVFDHSPVALLAARGLPARRALIGSGFCCPPDTFPLPLIRSVHDQAPLQKLRQDEDRMLIRANWVLGQWTQPPLERLGQLYGDVDETFLTTFPELDHYPQRGQATYWGPLNDAGGRKPVWPTGSGPKVFVYTTEFPALPPVLRWLGRKGWPTLVFGGRIRPQMQNRCAAPTISFAREPLDLRQVARQCDFAILNGGHGATSSILLGGKPVLLFPLFAEQRLTGHAVRRMGAGVLLSSAEQDEGVIEAGIELVSGGTCSEAAGRFADGYRDFDPHEQQRAIVQRGCELMGKAILLPT